MIVQNLQRHSEHVQAFWKVLDWPLADNCAYLYIETKTNISQYTPFLLATLQGESSVLLNKK